MEALNMRRSLLLLIAVIVSGTSLPARGEHAKIQLDVAGRRNR
jgi:hypothetical protein